LFTHPVRNSCLADLCFTIERGEDAVTPKQKRFCDEYLIDCNAVEAAKRAGYKGETCKNASRWLDPNSTEKYNAEMHKYIQDKLEEIQSKSIASATEVMQYLTSVLRGEETEEVIVVEGCGEGCSNARRIDKSVGARDKLKAAELLAKRYGLLTDKVGIEGVVPIVISGDDELED
jgi:phage terminase small subunit